MTKGTSLTAQARELKTSLADHLRAAGWITFTEMPLGSVLEHGGRIPRADVLAFQKSYVRPLVSIYEVKVSKDDAYRDIDTGKWEKYLPYCQRFYYAVPKGLLQAQDVPEPCGLMVKGDGEWRVQRAPKAGRQLSLDSNMLLACLFRGYEWYADGKRREGQLRMLELHRPITRKRAKELGRQLGVLIANPTGDLGDATRLKEIAEDYLGEEKRSLWEALSGARAKLKREIGVAQNIDLALDLVALASSLIHGEPLTAWGTGAQVLLELEKRRDGATIRIAPRGLPALAGRGIGAPSFRNMPPYMV